jgi:hypothetical protein
MAYGKEKIRGAERNLPDFFGLCPRCPKKFSGETFQNCCRRGEERSDYEKFLLDSIFPTKLTEFPTKLTEFVPFIFIIIQYLPDCEANIARLTNRTMSPRCRNWSRSVRLFGKVDDCRRR